MKNPSNQFIEELIKPKIHPDDKLVDVLMETLSLRKEAAYRRLRGEVPYTFDDIMKISSKYNISLDAIVGNRMPKTALITTSIFDIANPIGSYKEYLHAQIAIYKEVNKRKDGKALLAFNLIPYVLYSGYKVLNKFRLYRWIHQMDIYGGLPPFKEMEFPKELWDIHMEAIEEFSYIKDVSYIFDKGLFLNQVKDILLFVQLNLIDKESLYQMKSELLQILSDIEHMSNGSYNGELKRTVYLSNVSFESSYLYFEAEDYLISGLRLLGISLINTRDPWVCHQFKKWIDSLKRYSTLISVSGEIDRLSFLNQQKEFISQLDC